MSEDIKGLIEKINQEGVKAAEEKAREIEAQARQKAQEIVAKANQEASQIMSDARKSVERMQESGNVSLQQAGRDFTLTLRKEIDAMLDKIIGLKIQETLSPQEMAKIIIALVKGCTGTGKENVIVSLSPQDKEKLEKGFLTELKEEIKKGITLKSSQDIRAGFIISFDAGKSHFDFSDKALAQYIGMYLKPKLAAVLNKDKDK